MSIFFKVINPLVTGVLSSPLHRLMSGNTMILAMRGRKSQRRIQTPISYRQVNALTLHCFTGLGSRWWRNLKDNPQVEVLINGGWQQGRAIVEIEPPEAIAPHLADFLRAVPRDAPHSGVSLGPDGEPDSGQVLLASHQHVLIQINLKSG